MAGQDVLELVQEHGVIPVIAIDDAGCAVALADALIEGGLPVAEITFRTQAAALVIETIARERPAVALGAGTLLSPENIRRARDAGARFGVAPGVNPDVIREAGRVGLPFIPGVITPTEIEQALALGARLLKFFPAEAFGGLKTIKALAAPYAHVGVRFMPTGGVTVANLADYLAADVVACVGGTWIASREAIAEKKWSEIRDNCKAAVEAVQKLRG
ncbi:MAG TPA: bifunctional 4-hydroxy-2-oxoglutarate aldolase/2-dehydro-3-deoxy-phosphogluconate aldolase [bacterium]|nr:bifunctional 4-hydroxy-2-oxoglutarate aldolase/2-dehydro-3-deoxy-phosphogluconate aldolase [bacterium]